MRPRAACLQCGADVEALGYCGVCGASLRDSATASPRSALGRIERLGGAGRSQLGKLTLLLGSIAILAALLAGTAGVALAIAAFLPPLLIVIRLRRLDVFEREPIRAWYLAGLGGFLAGLATAIGDAFVIERFWFSGSTFHAGAAGFAGEPAVGQGPPPVAVLAFGGIVLPLAGLGLQFALPLLLRRLPPLRNEVVDGVILGASAGGGFAASTAIVYFWPLMLDTVSAIGVADATATILGVIVIRPVLFCLISGLIGAGIWRSALSQRAADLIIPVAAGLGGLFLYAVVSRLVMPFGALVELGWLVLITAVLAVLGRRELHRAIRFDRAALMTAAGRVVCPRCRGVTPAGRFCAACGEPLQRPRAVPRRSPRIADDRETASEPQRFDTTRPLEQPDERGLPVKLEDH